ncbi:MAG TPA: 2-amino-4-hydroxy-6-hydroxymethyldihydropteridine diphosphokinase [Gemmatimonadales bacterium]|nr:2-amino-4-hydroxy-6-hydroxymethyldihydropteridine diphosphokinase [Gemmatimonadales bacterium]
MTGPGGDITYVALGSNLGDRAAHLNAACEQLAALPATVLEAASTIEETAPLGGLDQPPYLNQMVRLRTGLTPRALLEACQRIEQSRGRRRATGARWASRTLDLDIVLFGDRLVEEPGLTIPHPRLPERDFWQRELVELGRDDR